MCCNFLYCERLQNIYIYDQQRAFFTAYHAYNFLNNWCKSNNAQPQLRSWPLLLHLISQKSLNLRKEKKVWQELLCRTMASINMNPKLYGLLPGHYVYAEIQSAVRTLKDPTSPPLSPSTSWKHEGLCIIIYIRAPAETSGWTLTTPAVDVILTPCCSVSRVTTCL